MITHTVITKVTNTLKCIGSKFSFMLCLLTFDSFLEPIPAEKYWDLIPFKKSKEI